MKVSFLSLIWLKEKVRESEHKIGHPDKNYWITGIFALSRNLGIRFARKDFVHLVGRTE